MKNRKTLAATLVCLGIVAGGAGTAAAQYGGDTEPAPDLDAAAAKAEEIGYPIACKAVGGGGGKGFRVALTPDDLAAAFEGP